MLESEQTTYTLRGSRREGILKKHFRGGGKAVVPGLEHEGAVVATSRKRTGAVRTYTLRRG